MVGPEPSFFGFYRLVSKCASPAVGAFSIGHKRLDKQINRFVLVGDQSIRRACQRRENAVGFKFGLRVPSGIDHRADAMKRRLSDSRQLRTSKKSDDPD
jgi:hypothetical protein